MCALPNTPLPCLHLAAVHPCRLLELNPGPKIAEQVRGVLATCDKAPTDVIKVNYDPRNPFDICSLTFSPIYKVRRNFAHGQSGAAHGAREGWGSTKEQATWGGMETKGPRLLVCMPKAGSRSPFLHGRGREVAHECCTPLAASANPSALTLLLLTTAAAAAASALRTTTPTFFGPPCILPSPQGSKYVEDPYTGARFQPQCEGQISPLGDFVKIGADASGLLVSLTQIR